jgi:plasmid stabilization system protein ParE
MKIIWSDFASKTLREIYIYYKEVANKKTAKDIKNGIFEAANLLVSQPDLGQLELTLEKLGEGHRYLVRDNYKIIYKKVAEGIFITDVFDTRQDPQKINDKKRKSSK